MFHRRALEVAEGVVVGRGSVISMGVFLGASHEDHRSRATGEIFMGPCAALFSVVVPGTLPGKRAAGRLARAGAGLRGDS